MFLILQIVKTNLEKRHKEHNEDSSNALDTEMLMVLWHHIRRTDRRHQRVCSVLYQEEFLVKALLPNLASLIE